MHRMYHTIPKMREKTFNIVSKSEVIMAEPIHKILAGVFPQEHRWKVELLENWDSLIGNMKDKVRIEKIDRDVLTLGVVHPAWAQELYFFSGFLRDKINASLKKEHIKTIRFYTIGSKPATKRPRKRATKRPLPPISDVCLTPQGELALATIKNEEFRSALKKYYDRCRAGKEGVHQG